MYFLCSLFLTISRENLGLVLFSIGWIKEHLKRNCLLIKWYPPIIVIPIQLLLRYHNSSCFQKLQNSYKYKIFTLFSFIYLQSAMKQYYRKRIWHHEYHPNITHLHISSDRQRLRNSHKTLIIKLRNLLYVHYLLCCQNKQ